MQQHTAAAPSTSLTQHGDQQNSQHNQQPAGYTTFGPGTPGTAILMAQNQENIEQQQQQPPPLGRKLNIGEFLLYNSLLFGMCFAKKGGPPVFACPLAGCCCMDLPPHFDVRHRVFMFFFLLWLTFFLSIPVSYGNESAFWMFILLACIAAPVACILRCHLYRFSMWAQRTCTCTPACIRAEEVILIALYVGTIIWAAVTATGPYEFVNAMDVFWKAWLVMIGLDLLNLVYKYLCCWICCRCCIPNEDVFRGFMHWESDADVKDNQPLIAGDAANNPLV